jgi:spore coat polysaccharide biosynthesis predicted glycosyltransferase SpsG
MQKLISFIKIHIFQRIFKPKEYKEFMAFKNVLIIFLEKKLLEDFIDKYLDESYKKAFKYKNQESIVRPFINYMDKHIKNQKLDGQILEHYNINEKEAVELVKNLFNS